MHNGIDSTSISVEYHSRFQIPGFTILGLPGPEIQEARERIIAAFHASDLEFPKQRISVNLTPASLRKWGTGHDLAIALAILQARQSPLQHHDPESVLAWGELGLDGCIKAAGQIPALIDLLLQPAQPRWTKIILSSADAELYESTLEWRKQHALKIPQVQMVAIQNLKQLSDGIAALTQPGTSSEKPTRAFALPKRSTPTLETPVEISNLLPLSESLQRTLCISLLGRHHLLLLGPKGVGKSYALEWAKHLCPAASIEQQWNHCLQTEKIPDAQAPLRWVHSQVKPAHLLGSFRKHRLIPGELARSHGGILVADEFLEWPRDAKECLREPLQNRRFELVRADGRCRVECDFQLMATGNLCPCGGLPRQVKSLLGLSSPTHRTWNCRCVQHEVERYLSRVSGPILDRIDLVSVVSELSEPESSPHHAIELFHSLRQKIRDGREFSRQTYGGLLTELSSAEIRRVVQIPSEFKKALESIQSLRSRDKILRVGATIQCLERSDELRPEHLWEALEYRWADQLQI